MRRKIRTISRTLRPEEKSHFESLAFHLEGFRESASLSAKRHAIKKIFDLLQIGNQLKIDHFELDSLSLFWKNFNELSESSQNDPEILFWFQAIAILILFRNTATFNPNYVPSFCQIIFCGVSSIARNYDQEKQTQCEQKKDSEMLSSGRKRQFQPSSLPCPKIQRKFSSKRKFQGERVSTPNPPYLESPDLVGGLEVKFDPDGSVLSMWSSLAKLLMIQPHTSCFQFQSEHLPLLGLFITNRFLQLLVSRVALSGEENLRIHSNDSTEPLQCLHLLTEFRRTGSMKKVSYLTRELLADIISDSTYLTKKEENLRRLKLWLCMGILDSACFKNEENQGYLSREAGELGIHSSESLPTLVGFLIRDSCRQVISLISDINFPAQGETQYGSERSLLQDTWTVLSDLHPLSISSQQNNYSMDSETSSSILHISFFTNNIHQDIFDFHPSLESSRKRTPLNISTDYLIGKHDICISALKLAINLTTQCSVNCQTFLEMGLVETSLQFLVELFAWKKGHQVVKDSPVQKLIFDAALYQLTLLTNLTEILSLNFATDLASHLSVDSLPSHEQIIQYLVSLLLVESACFLGELEQTDHSLSKRICKQEGRLNSSYGGLSEESKATATSPIRSSEPLPIEELVLCTHIILFLVSLLSPSLSPNQSTESFIKQLLPRGTWWLPKRILIAYLALQDELDTIQRSSTTPVLSALRFFEETSSIEVKERT